MALDHTRSAQVREKNEKGEEERRLGRGKEGEEEERRKRVRKRKEEEEGRKKRGNE